MPMMTAPAPSKKVDWLSGFESQKQGWFHDELDRTSRMRHYEMNNIVEDTRQPDAEAEVGDIVPMRLPPVSRKSSSAIRQRQRAYSPEEINTKNVASLRMSEPPPRYSDCVGMRGRAKYPAPLDCSTVPSYKEAVKPTAPPLPEQIRPSAPPLPEPIRPTAPSAPPELLDLGPAPPTDIIGEVRHRRKSQRKTVIPS